MFLLLICDACGLLLVLHILCFVSLLGDILTCIVTMETHDFLCDFSSSVLTSVLSLSSRPTKEFCIVDKRTKVVVDGKHMFGSKKTNKLFNKAGFDGIIARKMTVEPIRKDLETFERQWNKKVFVRSVEGLATEHTRAWGCDELICILLNAKECNLPCHLHCATIDTTDVHQHFEESDFWDQENVNLNDRQSIFMRTL